MGQIDNPLKQIVPALESPRPPLEERCSKLDDWNKFPAAASFPGKHKG